MSQAFPLFLAVGAVAGAAGAAVSVTLSSSESTETTAAVDQDALRSISDELRDLIEENRDLRDRVDSLENTQSLVGPAPSRVDATPDEQDGAIQISEDELNEMRALIAQLKNPARAMPPNFEAWVEEANDAIQAREREERSASDDEILSQK